MKLVDVNVLVYAVNANDDRNDQARGWLDDALNGTETVAFAWLAVVGFLRISTRRGIFESPLPVDEAVDRVRVWLAQPPAVVVEPTARHLDVLADLLLAVGAGGNTSDAHLAALAIEHEATVVSFDRDFGRFPGLRWEPPG